MAEGKRMTPEERKQQILLERVEKFNPEFIMLKIFSVDDFTDAGIQISYSRVEDQSGKPEFEAMWIPLRMLMKDQDNNFWMIKEFFDYKARLENDLKKTGKRRLEMKR